MNIVLFRHQYSVKIWGVGLQYLNGEMNIVVIRHQYNVNNSVVHDIEINEGQKIY